MTLIKFAIQKRQLTLLLFVLIFGTPAIAQQYFGQQRCAESHDECTCELVGTGEDKFSFVRPPANFVPGADRAANIQVNYNGFTAQAQVAFQYAVDIWSSFLTSNVTIEINATFANLGAGVLGSAGPNNFHINFPGAIQNNAYFPSALADKLRGQDLDAGFADISCNFSNAANWYYGIDGNTPGGQYDFVTVVLHELGHGLGFIGGAGLNGNGTGDYGLVGNTPTIYTRFAQLENGTNLTSLTNNTAAVANALTGNQLYWGGQQAILLNNGNRPRLYAPGNFSGGSSFSHLNEATYGFGNVNSLMTPAVGTAEAIHDPGPIVEGMFSDMGWSIGQPVDCEISSVNPVIQTPCDPASNTYSQSLTITYAGFTFAGALSVNGQNFNITGSPQTVTLENLPSNGQFVDVSVSFTDQPDCNLYLENVFQAPPTCCGKIRLVEVDLDAQTFTLKNFGTCRVDLREFEVCDSDFCKAILESNVLSGDVEIEIGDETTFGGYSNFFFDDVDELSLYGLGSAELAPESIIDYVQWGFNGGPREALAVNEGLWLANTYLNLASPYTYEGNGFQNGGGFWMGQPFVCAILGVEVTSLSDCINGGAFYTVDVTFENAPTLGALVFNDQSTQIGNNGMNSFSIFTLVAAGQTISGEASFTLDETCTFSVSELLTLPDCTAIPCAGDLNDDGMVNTQDLISLVAALGCVGVGCEGDLNSDNQTNSADLLNLISLLGTDCP